MFYEAELRFLRETYRKCHLQTLLIDPKAPMDPRMDMGIRLLIQGEKAYQCSFEEKMAIPQPNTVYRMTDPFLCQYLFLQLPDTERETVLLIGPYLTEELSREQILERAEAAGVSPRQGRSLEQYYNELPLLSDSRAMFAILDTFAERLWGNGFTVTDICRGDEEVPITMSMIGESDAQDPVWNMQMMETRYNYENELMRAVEQGLTHKAELLPEGFSVTSFERRLTDPLRNAQNYCIIMNTLLRKAAENGGVHPVYLDTISSEFARKIETLPSTAVVNELMTDMFRKYCRLVKKYSMRNYSTIIQKVIAYIDSDLTADLSLHRLAETQNVSAGYLSALFHQETGKTLTDYVNEKRVRQAKQLLETTTLQIQTVAQHCGVLDVHYFSRLFKKYTGKTPKEYRNFRR